MNRRTSDLADREVVVTRRFKVGPEVLWEWWTDPARIVRWWGPAGFRTTIHEMDVRKGGVWDHVMHGPDGTDYPSKARFTDVVRHARLAYTLEGGTPAERISCEVSWTFVAEGRGAVVTMRMVFPTVEARDRAQKALGVREAGVETLNRLAALADATKESP